MTSADSLLDADRVADAGALWGQMATRPAWGGLVVASSRFVEYNVRATLLLVPGLFRVDLQPLYETLGLRLRELTKHHTRWEAGTDALDALRYPERKEPLEVRGYFDLPDRPLAAEVRLVVVGDTEAGGCYVAARAAVGGRG